MGHIYIDVSQLFKKNFGIKNSKLKVERLFRGWHESSTIAETEYREYYIHQSLKINMKGLKLLRHNLLHNIRLWIEEKKYAKMRLV